MTHGDTVSHGSNECAEYRTGVVIHQPKLLPLLFDAMLSVLQTDTEIN